MVRERQLMNDRIAIFLPQNRPVYGFAQGLTEAGIEVEVPKQRGSGASRRRTDPRRRQFLQKPESPGNGPSCHFVGE